MEVIVIDSSDDDEVVPKSRISASRARAKECNIVTPRDLTQTQSDGDSSVSSADSIWEAKGFFRREKGGASLCKSDVSVVSDDEYSYHVSSDRDHCIAPSTNIATKIQDTTQSDASSISSTDSFWDKVGLSLKPTKEGGAITDITQSNASSISSTDSFWDKVGVLPSKPTRGGDGSCKTDVSLDSYDELEPTEEVGATDITHSDASSISSADSIWDKVGLLPSKPVQAGGAASSSDVSVDSDDELLEKIAGLKFGGSDARDWLENESEDIHNTDKACDNVPKASSQKKIKNPYISDEKREVLEIIARQKFDERDARDQLENGNEDINNAVGVRAKAPKASSHKKSKDAPINDNIISENQLPPEVPLPVGASWKIVLLMDHREFGCANNFLQVVEKKINKHFGGAYSEICTLASADYMFVARLISNATGKIMSERVLDMVIERKEIKDASQCLIADSKKYKPLSFFEAQMYKLQHCGISKKLFLMEGDEDKTKHMFAGAKSEMEKKRRLKRVKSLRMQLEDGEYQGVAMICTRNRYDTIKFLIQQLECFHKSFNPRRPPTKTMEQLKLHINEQMKAPTFLEYLRLRSIPGIGDVTAMKVIMDPKLDWDKTFISPSSKKKAKSTLEDRATFWKYSKTAASKKLRDTSIAVPSSATTIISTTVNMKMASSATFSKHQEKSATGNSKTYSQTVKDKESSATKPLASTTASKSHQNSSDTASSKKNSQTCNDPSIKSKAGGKLGSTKKNTSIKGKSDSLGGAQCNGDKNKNRPNDVTTTDKHEESPCGLCGMPVDIRGE